MDDKKVRENTCVSDSDEDVTKFAPNKLDLTASRIVLSKILKCTNAHNN